jgi:hypothetical protein
VSHTANDLRQLAEEADGTRAKDLYIVIRKGELDLQTEKPAAGEAFVKVHTGWRRGGLRATAQLRVVKVDIPKTADAVFSSQSAIEKFVIPYYSRSRTPTELQELLRKLYRQGKVAAFHLPGSIIDAAGEKLEAGLHLVDENSMTTFIAV